MRRTRAGPVRRCSSSYRTAASPLALPRYIHPATSRLRRRSGPRRCTTRSSLVRDGWQSRLRAYERPSQRPGTAVNENTSASPITPSRNDRRFRSHLHIGYALTSRRGSSRTASEMACVLLPSICAVVPRMVGGCHVGSQRWNGERRSDGSAQSGGCCPVPGGLRRASRAPSRPVRAKLVAARPCPSLPWAECAVVRAPVRRHTLRPRGNDQEASSA